MKIIKAKYFQFVFLLVLLGSSCKDSTEKQPVRFLLGFDAIALADDAILMLEKGEINIFSLGFEGNRQGSDDIYFKLDYNDGIQTDIINPSLPDEFDFDIPQGVYNQLSISLELHSQGQGQATIAVDGTVWIDNDEVALRYENFDFITLSKYAINSGSNLAISSSMNPLRGTFLLDSNILFSSISNEEWNNAEISGNHQNPVIRINPDDNMDLYEQINNQILNAFELVIE